MIRVLALAALSALPAAAETVTAARYADPTTRYAHGVLGDDVEWGTLELDLDTGVTRRLILPEVRVFEDLAPRLHDLDGDGAPEVIVVESHAAYGARLAVYGPTGLIAANDWIGASHRWLAPAGIADIDGDGFVEIGYVDRPHLAKTLTVLRFRDGNLEPVATLRGVTNHRIGDDFISGGMRACAGRPEYVLVSGDWRAIVAVRWQAGELVSDSLGPFEGQHSIREALDCR